jgi:hypothetical protein
LVLSILFYQSLDPESELDDESSELELESSSDPQLLVLLSESQLPDKYTESLLESDNELDSLELSLSKLLEVYDEVSL